MNRRNFFKTLFGLAAVPLVAYLPETKAEICGRFPGDTGFISIDALKRAAEKLRANAVAGPYTVYLQPESYTRLRATNSERAALVNDMIRVGTIK